MKWLPVLVVVVLVAVGVFLALLDSDGSLEPWFIVLAIVGSVVSVVASVRKKRR